MASSSKEMELAIKIAGKVDASFTNALGKAQSGVVALTKTITAATAAAAAAVGAIGAAAVNVGKEFETAMSQVQATMLLDTSTAEGAAAMATLEEAARECGRTTAFSATEAAEALNYLALAGYNADEAATALPTVLKLAGAGAMDLAAASDMVTDSMSALGIEATESNLNSFADQLAQTASKANTSVSQLGDAILTVGGTAKGLAGGTTELNTALGILADNGLKGAEGGTHLRNMILSLQNPTGNASKALQSLGVDVYDAQGNMRGLNDIFKDLQSGMEGMTAAQKDSIISTLFNKTDLTAANAMLSNCTDRWDELSAAIENSAGACEDMYSIQLDNLDGDIKILQSGLSDLGISIYKDLNGPLREMTQLGTSMVEELSQAYSEGGMAGMVGAVGGCLSDVVKKIGDYAPKVLEMGIGLIEGFIQGIVENADSIGSTAAELIAKFVTGISGMLPEVANAAIEIITSFANSMLEGDNLTTITQGAVNAISGFINAIIDHLPEIMEIGRQVITQLITGILSGTDGSFGDMAARVGILVFALKPLLGLFGGISGIMGKLSGLVGKATSLFSGFGSAAQTVTAPAKAAAGGLQALTANAKGLLALGAAFLMVAAGMALLSASAIAIANAGPGAAAALVLLIAAVAGMAVGAAALAPALMAGAAGLVAFGAGVALVGVGILAATAGLALLATQLPTIVTYGGGAAAAILLISAALVALAAGSLAAAGGLAALFLPMVGGAVTTAALGAALAALTIAAGAGTAAIALLTTAMAALNVTMSSIKNNAKEAGDSIGDMREGVDVITTGLKSIQSMASDAIKAFASIFKKETPTVESEATGMVQGLNQALENGFNAAKTKALQTANAIKSAFENMTITIPKPRMPVISLSTNSISYRGDGNVSIPRFSVNWNAVGGIFETPTVLNTASNGLQGVGEAGAEAVLPLDTLWSKMKSMLDSAIKESSGGGIIEFLLQRLQGIGTGGGGGGTGGPELAGAGGPNISYAPVYNLYGSATKEDAVEAERTSQAEFNRMMKQWQRENDRKRF